MSEAAFIESRSIRDRQRAARQGDRAEAILNKVKALIFAVWQGQGMSRQGKRQSFMSVWTPRAALRLGMLLRDSAVARQIRTQLIE
ncbi:MAG TPA: hypothetical protein V6C50_07390 [Crinalium sp.]